MSCGIYKIENLINHKVYIGQSIDIEKRWEEHKFYRKKENTVLQKAFCKYGISNFDFSIIEECQKEELNDKEKYWIKYYNSYENGYNMTYGGEGSLVVDYQKVLQVYQTNYNLTKTSQILNININTVRKIINYYNIPYDKTSSLPHIVVMIDPYTLKEIKTFNSICEAGRYLNISEAMIRKHLRGEATTAGGYYWKVLGEDKNFTPLNKDTKIQNTTALKILQYDDNNNLIKIYPSLSQANKALGKSRSNQSIKQACENHSKVFGYYWKIEKGEKNNGC